MYLVDSNTFSELVQPVANQKVIDNYLANQSKIYLAVTVWQEMCFGYHRMPDGKRKDKIHAFLYEQILALPMLMYDKTCADIHAKMRADCEKKGKTLSYSDSQIASIALAHGLTVVTRNVRDFQAIDGLHIVNWFD